MIFVSIIFHLKLILVKNYLMSHLLDTVFNFLLIYVLLFPQQRLGLSASKYNNLYLSMFEVLEYESCNQVVTITELESNSVMS
jgi:hypothetical protein